MLLRGHTGTAGRIHRDGYLRHFSLEEQGVGYDADIGAESHELNFEFAAAALIFLFEHLGEPDGAEGGFVEDMVFRNERGHLRTEFPPRRVGDAVVYRKKLSLLCLTF